jgi:hypothetical protein
MLRPPHASLASEGQHRPSLGVLGPSLVIITSIQLQPSASTASSNIDLDQQHKPSGLIGFAALWAARRLARRCSQNFARGGLVPQVYQRHLSAWNNAHIQCHHAELQWVCHPPLYVAYFDIQYWTTEQALFIHRDMQYKFSSTARPEPPPHFPHRIDRRSYPL